MIFSKISPVPIVIYIEAGASRSSKIHRILMGIELPMGLRGAAAAGEGREEPGGARADDGKCLAEVR